MWFNCNIIVVKKKIYLNIKNILEERKGKCIGDIYVYFVYCVCVYFELEFFDCLMIFFLLNCCDLVLVLIFYLIVILMFYFICCDWFFIFGFYLLVY